jgi:hypothetical protein
VQWCRTLPHEPDFDKAVGSSGPDDGTPGGEACEIVGVRHAAIGLPGATIAVGPVGILAVAEAGAYAVADRGRRRRPDRHAAERRRVGGLLGVSVGSTFNVCVSREEYDRSRLGAFWHERTDT